MLKKKINKVTLLPDQAKMFFDKLVETAPQYLYFMDEDTRNKVLDRLKKILCTGEPVVLDGSQDLVSTCLEEVKEEDLANV